MSALPGDYTETRDLVLQATGGRIDASNPTTTNATYQGVISGNFELTKIGAGTMNLRGTNTYTGGTILNSGTTSIVADDNLGAAGTGVTFTGGTLRLDTAGTDFSRPITMTGNGGINSPGDNTLSSVLTGNGNFTKSGAGRLTLTSANPAFGPGGTTAGGRITVSAGTLVIPSDAPASVLGVAGTLAGGGAENNTLVSAGATLEITGNYNGGDQILIAGDGVAGGGALRKVGNNITTIAGKGVTLNGATTGGRVTAAEGELVLSNSSLQRNNTTGPPPLTFDGAGNIRTTRRSRSWQLQHRRRNQPRNQGRHWHADTGRSQRMDRRHHHQGRDGAASPPMPALARSRLAPVPRMRLIASSGRRHARIHVRRYALRQCQSRDSSRSRRRSHSHRQQYCGSVYKHARQDPRSDHRHPDKTGPGEFRYNGTATQTRHATSFTQLIVNEGLYRLGNVAGQNTELGFGAAPAAPTADAIVLNGGRHRHQLPVPPTPRFTSTGASNAARNGGFLHQGGGPITIPGVVTGSGILNVVGGSVLRSPGSTPTPARPSSAAIRDDDLGGITPDVRRLPIDQHRRRLGLSPAPFAAGQREPWHRHRRRQQPGQSPKTPRSTQSRHRPAVQQCGPLNIACRAARPWTTPA